MQATSGGFCRAFGLTCGEKPFGPHNSIPDMPGVNGLIRQLIAGKPKIGRSTGAVNTAVMRCGFIASNILAEERSDPLFEAIAETTREAALNTMIAFGSTKGFKGHKREILRQSQEVLDWVSG